MTRLLTLRASIWYSLTKRKLKLVYRPAALKALGK